jgi:hypothetical protein
MTHDKRTLLVPILAITLGSGWLLTALDVAPRIDWVWTLCLAVVGLLTLAVGGIDKVTVVVGPFFLIASCLSVFRQAGRMSVDVEVPILVILAGVLLLIARSAVVPMPKWVSEDPDGKGPAAGA